MKWLPCYSLQTACNDFIAGLTVGLMVVPQSIAYAQIANVHKQVHSTLVLPSQTLPSLDFPAFSHADIRLLQKLQESELGVFYTEEDQTSRHPMKYYINYI